MSILWNQMGSTMRSIIFNEWLAKAIRNGHNTARKHIKQNRHRSTKTPATSAHQASQRMPCPPFIYCLTTEAIPMAYKHHQESPCVENGGRETDSPSIPSSHKHRKHVVEGQGCSWTDHHSHSSNSTGQHFLSVTLTWKISPLKNNRGWKILSLGIIVLIWLCNSYFLYFSL